MYGHAATLLLHQDAGGEVRDIVHRLHDFGWDRRRQRGDCSAARAAQLRAVHARGNQLERREQAIRVGDAPAGEHRRCPAEAANHALEQRHEARGHADRIGGRRHTQQGTVDIDEKGASLGTRQHGARPFPHPRSLVVHCDYALGRRMRNLCDVRP